MASNYVGGTNRFKRISAINGEPSITSSRIWPKKSLQIEVDQKELRETDATLSSTPKNKKGIQPTDFAFLKFLGNGKFG